MASASSQASPGARVDRAAPSAPVPSGSPGPAELVTRPDPGLARGVWEAPPWAFWAALAVVVVAATLYALSRAGLVKRPGAPRGPKT